MKQSGRNPILAARCAALGYIREKLYPHAMLSDLKISIKRLTGNCGDKGMDLSYPLIHRMGGNAAAVPKDGTELSANTMSSDLTSQASYAREITTSHKAQKAQR